MNNNAPLYTEFTLYFNRINRHKNIRHLLVLHIRLLRLGQPHFTKIKISIFGILHLHKKTTNYVN